MRSSDIQYTFGKISVRQTECTTCGTSRLGLGSVFGVVLHHEQDPVESHFLHCDWNNVLAATHLHMERQRLHLVFARVPA